MTKKRDRKAADQGVPVTMEDSQDDFETTTITKLQKWEQFTHWLKKPLEKLLVGTARFCALNPYKAIGTTIIFSFGIVMAGFVTNFYLETDNAVLWSPSGSITAKHSDWVGNPADSGFPQDSRKIVAIIHANGENVLHLEGMQYVFDVMEKITGMRS